MDSPIYNSPTTLFFVEYTPEVVEFAKKIIAVTCPDKPKNQWVQLKLDLEPKENSDG